jgi:hypothetical protein
MGDLFEQPATAIPIALEESSDGRMNIGAEK